MQTARPAALSESVAADPLRFGVLFSLLTLCVLAPLFMAEPLPLADYANHLARLHILSHWTDSEPLRRYYDIEWAAIPNLASDLLVPPLVRLSGLGVHGISVLFIAVGMVLTAAGTAVLNRVLFGHWSYLSLGAFLLLYNRQFLWGFMNYLFTAGLMLWCLAGWIHVRECRHWRWRLPFCLATTLLFFGHMGALGIYGFCVAAYELWRAWPGRRPGAPARERLADLVLGALQFLPPLWLLLSRAPTAGQASVTFYGDWLSKVSGLFDMFHNYSMRLDVASWLLVFGALLYGLLRKYLRVHPAMVWPLLALAGVYVAIPETMFNSWGADRRLVPVVTTIFLAALGIARPLSTMQLRCWVGIIATLFVVRMGVITWHWSQADATYQRYMAIMDRVETGSRVAYLVSRPRQPWLAATPIDHIGNLLVVRRDAFQNGMFAEHGSQPVVPRYNRDTAYYKFPSNAYIGDTATVTHPSRAIWSFPLDRFDFVYIVGQRHFASDLPAQLEFVVRDPMIDTALYKILR